MSRLKKCELLTIVCLVLGSLLIYLAFVGVIDERKITVENTLVAGYSHHNPSTAMDTPITLLLRMPGRLLDHRARYYCDLFRSTVLFLATIIWKDSNSA